MEHIRSESMQRGSHTSTSPGGVPDGKKKRFGACFGRGTKKLPLVRSRQFWSLHGFQSESFLKGPGVQSEDRSTSIWMPEFERMIAVLLCFEFKEMIFNRVT